MQQGERIKISEITDAFVALNKPETTTPQKTSVAVYRELQALQDELSRSLRGVFAHHRQFATTMAV